MTDNVNHPAHYETGKFECIEVMLETQGVEATKDFCVCAMLSSTSTDTGTRTVSKTLEEYQNMVYEYCGVKFQKNKEEA